MVSVLGSVLALAAPNPVSVAALTVDPPVVEQDAIEKTVNVINTMIPASFTKFFILKLHIIFFAHKGSTNE